MKKRFFIIAAVFLLALSTPIWSDGNEPVCFSSVDAAILNNYAIGTYADYYSTGIGAAAQFNFDITPVKGLGFFSIINYAYGFSNTDWVDSFNDISLYAGISYHLTSEGALTLSPELGYGVTNHIAIGDIDRDNTSSADLYVDQSLFLSIKALYKMNDSFSVFINPKMTALIEGSGLNLLPGYETGVRIHL